MQPSPPNGIRLPKANDTMGVSWIWENDEQTIVRFTFVDPWTWEDFLTANAEAGDIVANLNHVVDAIFDFRAGGNLPLGAISVFGTAGQKSLETPTEGLTVVIGMNSFMRTMYNVIVRIHPELKSIVRIASDDDEALAIIATAHLEILDGDS